MVNYGFAEFWVAAGEDKCPVAHFVWGYLSVVDAVAVVVGVPCSIPILTAGSRTLTETVAPVTGSPLASIT